MYIKFYQKRKKKKNLSLSLLQASTEESMQISYSLENEYHKQVLSTSQGCPKGVSLDLESDKMMLRKQIPHILYIDLLENDQVQSAAANCQGVPNYASPWRIHSQEIEPPSFTKKGKNDYRIQCTKPTIVYQNVVTTIRSFV